MSRILVLMLLLVLGMAWMPVARAGELAEARPNIIFMLADDLGFGDLGCYGQGTLKTPRLDRMAAEGMRFTRHYAGSTVCAPSRCVLMTGLHTGHCRVRGNGPGQLLAEDFTVAELLKEAGYTTACIGKWGIGNPPPIDDPARNGFDYFFGYVNMFHAHNFYPEFLYRNGERVALRNVTKPHWLKDRPDGGDKEGSGVAEKKVDYAPDLLTDDVLAYLDRKAKGEAPFFLYYALNVPHANNEGGRKEEGGDGMEVPDWGEFASREEWPGPEKGFASMIRNIDRDVGRILDKVEELGIGKETLVLFSSDNGPHQEGGHKVDFFDSNGPLRGLKRDLFDGGVRVPLIARWPGRIEGGSETAHISAFQDFLPTCAELAGAEAPEGTDGISYVATLAGDEKAQEEHAYLYWEFGEKGGKQGVLAGDWKAIRHGTVKNPGAPIELYQLGEDLGEEKDVAAEHAGEVERLAKMMEEAHAAEPRVIRY